MDAETSEAMRQVYEVLRANGWRPARKDEQPGTWIEITSRTNAETIRVRCVRAEQAD